jgi:hypothetical protein
MHQNEREDSCVKSTYAAVVYFKNYSRIRFETEVGSSFLLGEHVGLFQSDFSPEISGRINVYF